MTSNSLIYFDHNATTKLLLEAKEALVEVMDAPLNASSIHSLGRKAKYYKEIAKDQILSAVGLSKEDYRVIFTSSGTEANNLVIKNFYEHNIIMSPLEHLSVYKHKDYTDNISMVQITNDGLIDLESLEILLSKAAARVLVSVMIANNETGIIQPMDDIVKLCSKYGAYLHSDACQAIGKMDLDFAALSLDFITISAHKFGGLQGAAALICKKKHHLIPHLVGGGQEYGLRSGSENIAAIVAMGKAASVMCAKYQHNNLAKLRDKLESELLKIASNIKIIGYNQSRLSNTSAISMPNVSAIAQMVHFDTNGFAISVGSACSSGSAKVSHVLKAMNISDEDAENTIRVSLGIGNNEDEIMKFVQSWKEIYINHQ